MLFSCETYAVVANFNDERCRTHWSWSTAALLSKPNLSILIFDKGKNIKLNQTHHFGSVISNMAVFGRRLVPLRPQEHCAEVAKSLADKAQRGPKVHGLQGIWGCFFEGDEKAVKHGLLFLLVVDVACLRVEVVIPISNQSDFRT